MKLGSCRWCGIEDDLAIVLQRANRATPDTACLFYRVQRRLEQGS
jgi:hypothetical protein